MKNSVLKLPSFNREKLVNYYIDLFYFAVSITPQRVFAYANISAKSKPYAKILDLVSKFMAHMGKNQEGKIYGQKSCDTLPLNTFYVNFLSNSIGRY